MEISPRAALLLIDLQCAIDAPYWAAEGERNNPDAETNVARALALWRAAGRPVIHIRHDSREPNSAYRPGQPGHAFKPEAAPQPGEPVISKHTGNAFVDTPLHTLLTSQGIDTLFIAGVITNNSVESTVRGAGDLGFKTYLIENACFTFARRDFQGRLRTAEEVHALSLANLEGEYCTVITTTAVPGLESTPGGHGGV